MTTTLIAFARRHDWFIGTDGHGVWVQENFLLNGRKIDCPPLYFTDLSDLRDWAGY